MVPSISTGRLIDIGYGKPIELSSTWGGLENTGQLLPGVYGFPEDYAFHTDVQVNPFIIVDMLALRTIKRIRIFNREAFGDRAMPMRISISADKTGWTDIALINFVFGGQRGGEPLELVFAERIRARYLRLLVEKDTYFHLDYIEVCEQIPELYNGRLQKIDAAGPMIKAEYSHYSSYGFSWTFTLTLRAISECRGNGIAVSSIDYSSTLAPFKARQGIDLYPVLFELTPYSERFEILPPVWFMHHGIYSTFNLEVLHEYAALYFSPSRQVLAFQDELILRYGLELNRALAIVYRGTDKGSEVKPTPIERYIDVALAALQAQPDLQIIIQTDQEQALLAVRAAIPHAIHFRELPVTSGNTAIHRLRLEDEYEISKPVFAVRMLAVTHLLSKARYVVAHTGNISFWIAIYRGCPEGFFQFDRETELRDPQAAIVPSTADLAEVFAAPAEFPLETKPEGSHAGH